MSAGTGRPCPAQPGAARAARRSVCAELQGRGPPGTASGGESGLRREAARPLAGGPRRSDCSLRGRRGLQRPLLRVPVGVSKEPRETTAGVLVFGARPSSL